MVSSAFFHANAMHIGMNMMSYHSSGSDIEKALGSIRYFVLIMLLIFVPAALYIALAFGAAQWPFKYDNLQRECAVGFSGVLFGLMAIKAIVTPSSTTTVIFFQVPSTLMPWVSLAMIQVMIPGASFVGHLAGILTAYMYVYGCLDFAMPPQSTAANIEARFPALLSLPAWVPTTVVEASDAAARGGAASEATGGAFVCLYERCWQPLRVLANRIRWRTMRRRAQGYGQAPTDEHELTEIETVAPPISTSVGVPATCEVDVRLVYRIMEMGFARADATHALRESHNDLERAVAMLTPRSELYDLS